MKAKETIPMVPKAAPWRTLTLASCLTICLGLITLAPGMAQTDPSAPPAAGGTFTDQTTPADPGAAPAAQPDPDATADSAAADANSGPVRMARFSVVSGDVTWRGGTDGEWTTGTVNMPLRQGAQVWVSTGGRAEVQFDDGSRLRLDANTLVTLQTLYSDSKGEYTEITLNDGEATLRATNQYSVYQVNTPLCAVKAAGPAEFRVGAGNGVQVGVRNGTATVQGAADHARLHTGDYIDLVDSTTPYNITDLPQADAWDTWNVERDKEIDGLAEGPTAQHLPTDINISAGDLDSYGTWHDDPVNGWVWVPAQSDPNWRPYCTGSWTWVDPFGWTWVGAEPWGWAPYHYGSWVHDGWGWAWVPGPRYQYWSPGVVAFYQGSGSVAWCPLGPREVVYPATLGVGFAGRDWSLFFSIGGAAVYYPGPRNVYVARAWSPVYLNHVTYVRNVTVVDVAHGPGPSVLVAPNTHFVSVNARFGGVISTSAAGFGGPGGRYVPVAHPEVFLRSVAVVGGGVGGRPLAGPPAIRPTLASYSPNRAFTAHAAVPDAVVNRTVFRGTLPAVVARSAQTQPLAGQRFVSPPARVATATRPAFGTTSAPARAGTAGGSSGLQDYLRERNGGGAAVAGTNGTSRGGAPFAGGRGATAGSFDQAEAKQSTAIYGHAPVERNTQSAPRSYGGSTASGSAYRPLHTSSPSSNSGSSNGNHGH